MTTVVTLEAIQAKQAEITKMIEAFTHPMPKAFSIPASLIELAPGEHYAGIVLGQDGEPQHHLVLLPGDAEDLTWDQAKAWAAEQGGELPTRQEQSLLFANLKGQFEERAYWSGQAHETESSWAWYQYFDNGGQSYDLKDDEFRARAVRRLVIE